MSRLETIVKLKTAEERVQDIKAAIHDVTNRYCKDVSITIQLNTDAYPYDIKYDGSPINVNKTAIHLFLRQELEKVEKQIKVLIGELTND
jgi:uncharacterized protein with von Willebrand factor type A (vWA) domain